MKQSDLSARDRNYIVKTICFLQLVHGVYVILMGSVIPLMREEYLLNYEQSGALLSAHSAGLILTGILSSFLPELLGLKGSILLLNAITYAGFAMTIASGNYIWLLAAFFLIGIGRGSMQNYNNTIINEIVCDNGRTINLIHACFSLGAVLAPYLAIVCTQGLGSSWKLAVSILIGMGIVTIAASIPMKLGGIGMRTEGRRENAYGFLREKVFWLTTGILFCSSSFETCMIGWLVTYFTDTGMTDYDYGQVLISILWAGLLAGRLVCGIAAKHVAPARLLVLLTVLTLGVYLLLLQSQSVPTITVFSFLLGLGMSGMFASGVQNLSKVLIRYDLSMGFCNTLTSIGPVIAPLAIGVIAERIGMRAGMGSLFIFIGVQLLLAAINLFHAGKRPEETVQI